MSNDTPHSMGIGHLEGVASDSVEPYIKPTADNPLGLEPTDAMIDLETLGTEPFAPLLSIGACALRLDIPHAIDDMFYVPIQLESCLEVGMRPSGSTIQWWMTHESITQEARDAAFSAPNAVPLATALDSFTDWLQSRPLKLWGNSARFDLGLLAAAYKVCGKTPPWNHWDERCYRTLKNLPAAKDIKFVRVGTYHNAVHDAVSQALHLRQINLQLQLHL